MGGVRLITRFRILFPRTSQAVWLVAIVGVAWTVACSEGTTSPPPPFPTFTEPNLENRTITNLTTLEEAQDLASFDVRVPSGGNFDFEFLGGSYTPPIFGGSSDYPIDDIVELLFGDGKQQVFIMQAATNLKLGGPSEPIEVADVTGELVHGEPYGYPSTVYVSWTKDERSYSASTTLNESFNFDNLLALLDTIS